MICSSRKKGLYYGAHPRHIPITFTQEYFSCLPNCQTTEQTTKELVIVTPYNSDIGGDKGCQTYSLALSSL